MACVLYVKKDCPHCRRARERLAAKGVRVTVIDVEERPEVVPELLKLTGGRRIVPVVVEGTTVEVAPEGGTPF